MKKYTVADYISDFIADKKVPAVFELSGGMIAFITDAVARLGKTQIIDMKHEQACGFAAEAASRISGIPGVALATSGPGATNLLTAIGSCYFDSTACLFITGQVNQLDLRVDKNQRQNGFQELDIVTMVEGITKYAQRLETSKDLPALLQEAWDISLAGRRGPVLIDIPINLQQEASIRYERNTGTSLPNEFLNHDSLFRDLQEMLNQSLRPVVLVGGGIRGSRQVSAFRKFVERLEIPVVYSLMGKDALPTNSPLNSGMIGTYGNRWSNKIISESDLIIVFGSRLDVRQTGSSVEKFQEGKRIIRIDVDLHEIKGRISSNLEFLMTLEDFFFAAQDISSHRKSVELLQNVQQYKRDYPAEMEQEVDLDINPNSLCEWISDQFSESNGFVVDVGQHQMWAAQSLNISESQRFITSGGMGAMGFSLPAAIGAASTQDGKWVVIAGDGSLQICLAELETIAHKNLPIAICVLNNGQHGMVAQFQDENMDGRYIGTRDGHSAPNFSDVAKAFGIPSLRIESSAELNGANEFIMKWKEGAILLEFMISNKAKALPKMGRFSD
jgi:acetolactate synthase-1/2/3 large subunit